MSTDKDTEEKIKKLMKEMGVNSLSELFDHESDKIRREQNWANIISNIQKVCIILAYLAFIILLCILSDLFDFPIYIIAFVIFLIVIMIKAFFYK